LVHPIQTNDNYNDIYAEERYGIAYKPRSLVNVCSTKMNWNICATKHFKQRCSHKIYC